MSEEIEIKDEVLDLKVTDKYDENQIQVLEGLEAVRSGRMYIGSTSARGLHHLVYEIVDNSIDEALAGYCTHIEVTIEKGDIIRVAITAVVFPAVFTRRWASQRSRLYSPSCTQAASSTAPATRYPAACTALARRS